MYQTGMKFISVISIPGVSVFKIFRSKYRNALSSFSFSFFFSGTLPFTFKFNKIFHRNGRFSRRNTTESAFSPQISNKIFRQNRPCPRSLHATIKMKHIEGNIFRSISISRFSCTKRRNKTQDTVEKRAHACGQKEI